MNTYKNLPTRKQSARSAIITRRTYNRPLNDEGTKFETWFETVDRVIEHQKWLWERAKGKALSELELEELEQLRFYVENRFASVSGRTLWLGGTNVAKTKEASQFNCAFTVTKTVNDIVDVAHLLLCGCGVGFKPEVGSLNGFTKRIQKLEIIPSIKVGGEVGVENNEETFVDGVWTIKVGDSADAWAKAIGKIMAGKYSADKLVVDFSEIRPAGYRLKSFGWISSGYEPFEKAVKGIFEVMNNRSGQLLRKMDILDVVNWIGTILSSRRSAEICLFEYGSPEWKDFSKAKDYGLEQRWQSNNSLLFNTKPSREELMEVLGNRLKKGASEPGVINAETARKRFPSFEGVNPCGEILLPSKGFCNLVEIDVSKFVGRLHDLKECFRIMSRANYRQTQVNLRDGILQDVWHENNEFYRICGVGITGIRQNSDLTEYELKQLKYEAVAGANSMADELDTPRAKSVTTVKPSGTLGKVLDAVEGIHLPLGKYIINNVLFSNHDPLLAKLKECNYKAFPHPSDASSTVVALPVSYEGIEFTEVNGTPVNLESAIDQLEFYKKVQVHYCEQNVSNTISYDPSEVDVIIDWLLDNWDIFVGLSFLLRNDPFKTSQDLGYPYLPQEVVTREAYYTYLNSLKDFDINSLGEEGLEAELEDDCSGGACPIR